MCLAAIWSIVMPPYGSWLMRGGTQESHVPGVIACTGAAMAGLFSSPEITVSCFWNGCRGARIGGMSKSAPSFFGVHLSMTAPWGKYTNTMRGLPAAAVFASAMPAGIIASSSGSETLAPMPRRTVRRERCFLVMNIALLL